MSENISSPTREYGTPKLVPGKTSLSGKFRVLLLKALLIFDCVRTPLSLLGPYWQTSLNVKLYLASHIARRAILNVH